MDPGENQLTVAVRAKCAALKGRNNLAQGVEAKASSPGIVCVVLQSPVRAKDEVYTHARTFI